MGSTGLRLNSDAGYVNVQSRNVTGDALDPQWKVPNKALSLSLSESLSRARRAKWRKADTFACVYVSQSKLELTP
jgi:hypothetical protein